MKHLIFAILLLTTGGVHAMVAHVSSRVSSRVSSHSSSHVSSHVTSTPHLFSVGHPSYSKSMPVTTSFYNVYGHPPLFINLHNSDDECKPPKKCNLNDLR